MLLLEVRIMCKTSIMQKYIYDTFCIVVKRNHCKQGHHKSDPTIYDNVQAFNFTKCLQHELFNYLYACLFLHIKINFSLSLALSLAYIKLHKFSHPYFINRTCTCTMIMMVNLKTSDKSNERRCKIKIEIL
jgi:hypothetical protein